MTSISLRGNKDDRHRVCLQFGFMGYFEARKGPWGFGSDTIYVALGTFTEVPQANVDVNQLIWTFWGMREINPWADLVFGVRWNRIEGALDFKGPDIQVGDTKNWVDPVVVVGYTPRYSGSVVTTGSGAIVVYGTGYN